MSCPLPPSPPIPHPIVCRIPPLVLLYILGLTIHPFWTTDLFTEDSVSRQALHIYKLQKLSPQAPYPCDQFCLFKYAPKIQNLNFQINFSIFFSHISNWINPWLLRVQFYQGFHFICWSVSWHCLGMPDCLSSLVHGNSAPIWLIPTGVTLLM